jgi:hypothetical protein
MAAETEHDLCVGRELGCAHLDVAHAHALALERALERSATALPGVQAAQPAADTCAAAGHPRPRHCRGVTELACREPRSRAQRGLIAVALAVRATRVAHPHLAHLPT